MWMCQLAKIGVMLNDIRQKRSIGLKFCEHFFFIGMVCILFLFRCFYRVWIFVFEERKETQEKHKKETNIASARAIWSHLHLNFIYFFRNILQCKLVNAGCCRLIKLNCLSFISLVLNDNKLLIKVTELFSLVFSSFFAFDLQIWKFHGVNVCPLQRYIWMKKYRKIGNRRKIILESANWQTDAYVARFIFESIAVKEFHYIGLFGLCFIIHY